MYKTLLWLFARTVQFLILCAVAVVLMIIVLTTIDRGQELPFALEFLLYPFSPLTAWGHELRGWSEINLVLATIIAVAIGLALSQISRLMHKIQAFCRLGHAGKKVEPQSSPSDDNDCTCDRSIAQAE